MKKQTNNFYKYNKNKRKKNVCFALLFFIRFYFQQKILPKILSFGFVCLILHNKSICACIFYVIVTINSLHDFTYAKYMQSCRTIHCVLSSFSLSCFSFYEYCINQCDVSLFFILFHFL